MEVPKRKKEALDYCIEHWTWYVLGAQVDWDCAATRERALVSAAVDAAIAAGIADTFLNRKNPYTALLRWYKKLNTPASSSSDPAQEGRC